MSNPNINTNQLTTKFQSIGPTPSGDTSGATDYTNLTTYVSSLGSTGNVRLQRGTYYLNANLTIPDGINLLGEGNSLGGGGAAATILRCTSAAAGITINGSGGLSGNFYIDGNSIGTTLLSRGPNGSTGVGSQRTFSCIDAVNSAQDGIIILGSQNDLWMGVNVQHALRDGLVLDDGAGGHAFMRCEFNESGRYGIRFDTAVTVPASGYSSPTHNEFYHCIIERPLAGAISCVYQVNGDYNAFRSCIVQDSGNLSGAMYNIQAGNMLIDSGYAQGSTTTSTGVYVNNGVVLTVQGRFRIQTCKFAWNIVGGSYTTVIGEINYNSNVNKFTGAGDPNQLIQSRTYHPVHILRDTTSDFAWVARLNSDNGYRSWLTADGTLRWANVAYSSDTTLARVGAGILKAGNVIMGAMGAPSLSSNGSFAFDSTLGNIVTLNLGANCTGSSITGGVTGQTLTIGFQQDGTGNRSYVWPTTNIKYAGATSPTVTTSTAYRADYVTFLYNGAQWYEISRSINVG